MSAECLLILSDETIYTFYGFTTAKLIKLANMAGVMHEADHASLSGAPGDYIN